MGMDNRLAIFISKTFLLRYPMVLSPSDFNWGNPDDYHFGKKQEECKS